MTLSINEVTKRYGGHAAVDRISLQIGDSEFVTLVGPSGCGKTTTLRLLAGFTNPDTGEITLDNAIISSSYFTLPPERRNMAMVFQSFANWPHMTVYDNIVYGLRRRKVSKPEMERRFREMVELVALHDMDKRYPAELSGGQQQRVALARALIVHPRVLLLDEPLSNLDARLRERMRSDLRQIQRRTGITFVYVTHDQAEALSMSDKIVVMEDGQIHQVGSPEEVYRQPRTAYVARFIANCNLVPATCVGQGSEDSLIADIGDGMHMICAGGPYRQAKAGEAVTVALPPDQLQLTSEPQETALNLTVRSAVYLGNQVEYILNLGKQELKISDLGRERRFAEGQQIYATIDPEYCYLFKDHTLPIDEQLAFA